MTLLRGEIIAAASAPKSQSCHGELHLKAALSKCCRGGEETLDAWERPLVYIAEIRALPAA